MEDQAEKFKQQKKHNGLLMVAASRGYLADAESLLEMGAALDCRDKQGRSPLHFAAAHGQLDVARFLWGRGAEVDAEMPDGRMPLHLAAAGGHAEVATFLLQKGAWAEAYDAQDDTPLHLAARYGHTDVMEALLRHGAKAGMPNKQELMPMGCALVGGHIAAAKLLQGWGASLADKPHGYSLLHLAAGMGALAAVDFLLDSGADPNERSNTEGATPLHSAALGGCARCTEALLQAGADAGIADAAGRLPADLAPPTDKRLSELLTPKSKSLAAAAAAQRARGAAEAGKASPPKPAHEQFRALPQARRRGRQPCRSAGVAAEQRSKVERWSLLDEADLAAALRPYPPGAAAEAATHIAQLQAARRLLNIHKAGTALHADEDFQADAAQPHVRAAIEAIRADTSQYERYAADPQILAVLQKMRRLHSVAQANGQRTVSIEDMLAQPGYQQRDAERQLAIEAACAAHLAAAAAAAACEPGSDAKAAAEAAFQAAFQEAKDAAGAGMAGKTGDGAAAAKLAGSGTGSKPSATSLLRQRAGGGTSSARVSAADAAAAGELEKRERARGPEAEDADVPEWMRGEFSWKKVWTEVWRQTQLALAMLLLFVVVAWVVRGRAPWTP